MSPTAPTAKPLRAQRRLALTGTPLENRCRRFWSLFDFLLPGLLDKAGFSRTVQPPHRRGRTRRPTPRRDHPAVYPAPDEAGGRELPRRRKSKSDQLCGLTDDQAENLRAGAHGGPREVFGEFERRGPGKSRIAVLAGLPRLRQAACHPRLLGLPREDKATKGSGRSSWRCDELVAKAIEGGHHVLVFSQFVKMLKSSRGDEGRRLPVRVPRRQTKERAGRVDRFQDDPRGRSSSSA